MNPFTWLKIPIQRGAIVVIDVSKSHDTSVFEKMTVDDHSKKIEIL